MLFSDFHEDRQIFLSVNNIELTIKYPKTVIQNSTLRVSRNQNLGKWQKFG